MNDELDFFEWVDTEIGFGDMENYAVCVCVHCVYMIFY